jgi:hypothetical protein
VAQGVGLELKPQYCKTKTKKNKRNSLKVNYFLREIWGFPVHSVRRLDLECFQLFSHSSLLSTLMGTQGTSMLCWKVPRGKMYG